MGIGGCQRLRQRGLCVTAQRLPVLRAVVDVRQVTAGVVTQTVGGEIGSVSGQALCDGCAALAGKGRRRRIGPAGSPACSVDRVGDQHQLACGVCERGVDVEGEVGDAWCLTVVEDFGYEMDEVGVIDWGRCLECGGATCAAGDLRSAGTV